MVFFKTGACDLRRAVEALKEYRFHVVRRGTKLTAQQPGKPKFRVELVTDQYVRDEAEEIGADTPYAEDMKECGSRFEIFIDDLDAALDEINSLMELQAALQDASQGYLFLTWNGKLSEPWKE
jgi:hypothetical protein